MLALPALLRRLRKSVGLSRQRFAAVCANAQHLDVGELDEWYANLEKRGRVYLAGWEIRLLATAFRRVQARVTFAELLAAADYREDYDSGSSPTKDPDPQGRKDAETVAA